MFTCSQNDFQRFVSAFPNLCANGLTSSEYCQLFKIDFETSRQELTSSYQAFVDCCQWLLKCRMDDYATHFSPTSEQVLAKLVQQFDRDISHGALISAVLFLNLPHVMHGKSPGLSIGISRFCSHYHRHISTLKPLKLASGAR